MELMDTSLDKFYKYVFEVLERRIPEPIIAKITVATVKALNYLKEKLKIIHRYEFFFSFIENHQNRRILFSENMEHNLNGSTAWKL